MKQHKIKHLTPFEGEQYRGYKVISSRGHLVSEYLESSYRVIENALSEHPRTFAFRVDLRIPEGTDPHVDLVTRFIESFKAKIRHDRRMASERLNRAHQTSIRYIWCRERNRSMHEHFHIAILLNKDAYHTLGFYGSSQSNLASKVIEAWASALGADPEAIRNSVHFPENPSYYVYGTEGMGELFYRVSYLCKAESKHYGVGKRAFGCSLR